jgi:hypothetical protein
MTRKFKYYITEPYKPKDNTMTTNDNNKRITWQFIPGQFILDNLSPTIYPRTVYLRQFVPDSSSRTIFSRQFIPGQFILRQFIPDNLNPAVYPRQFISRHFIPVSLSQTICPRSFSQIIGCMRIFLSFLIF